MQEFKTMFGKIRKLGTCKADCDTHKTSPLALEFSLGDCE